MFESFKVKYKQIVFKTVKANFQFWIFDRNFELSKNGETIFFSFACHHIGLHHLIYYHVGMMLGKALHH